jgi:hypothetical protein
MKLIKTADKTRLKITKKEWEKIGAEKGWMGKEAQGMPSSQASMQEVAMVAKEHVQKAMNLTAQMERAPSTSDVGPAAAEVKRLLAQAGEILNNISMS